MRKLMSKQRFADVMLLVALLSACSSSEVLPGASGGSGPAASGGSTGGGGQSSGGSAAGGSFSGGGSNGGAGGSSGGALGAMTGGSGGAAPSDGGSSESGGSGGSGGVTEGSGGAESETPFVLHPVDFPTVDGTLAFPASAVSPNDVSPAFTWEGTPSEAESLVFVFRDIGISAIKWVVWDVPPSVDQLPADISDEPSPAEVPGASQLGSLDHTGYAGPQLANEEYDFTLYALKVDHLEGTDGLTTKQIFDTVLPAQVIAQTDPVVVVNAQ